MRLTKAILEAENKVLKETIKDLEKTLAFEKEKVAYLQKNSMNGYASCMFIAVEKTTEAMSHVISDLKYLKRR